MSWEGSLKRKLGLYSRIKRNSQERQKKKFFHFSSFLYTVPAIIFFHFLWNHHILLREYSYSHHLPSRHVLHRGKRRTSHRYMNDTSNVSLVKSMEPWKTLLSHLSEQKKIHSAFFSIFLHMDHEKCTLLFRQKCVDSHPSRIFL